MRFRVLSQIAFVALSKELCWIARDMSLKVRLEAFVALGKIRLVSEGVLVQSLFKKILENKNRGSSISEYIIKESKCSLSYATGALFMRLRMNSMRFLKENHPLTKSHCVKRRTRFRLPKRKAV